MLFNPSLIHRRTAAGARAIYESSPALNSIDHLVLLLIGSRVSGEGLLTRLPNVGGERIAESLDRLLQAGLIETVSESSIAAEAAEPAAADREKLRVSAALARVEAETGAATLTAKPDLERGSSDAELESAQTKLWLGARAAKAGGAAESAMLTQFAITSINVPDALDLQEERDRAQWDEALQARRQKRFMNVTIRGRTLILVLAGIAVGLSWWQPLPDFLSAQALGADLSQLVGRPVSVEARSLVFLPSPGLVLSNVVIDGGVHADEVSIRASWAELWNGLSHGQWTWSEARVSPLTVRPQEALAVGGALLAHGDRLPERIATIRFEAVSLVDSPLLPGRYEVIVRRGADGRFGRLQARQLDAGDERLEVNVSEALPNVPPNETSNPSLAFELKANSWPLPFGSKARWNEVRASGRLAAGAVRISHYSLAGFYGVTTGSAQALFAKGEWELEGTTELANLDLEALQLARQKVGAAHSPVVFQGTANAALRFAGRGATLNAAVAETQFRGDFRVRWATLNRINLGAFAVNPSGMVGGTTRFTEFDGALRADRYGLSLIGVGGRAGAMTARGDVGIAADDAVHGLVRVELGGEAAIHAPITLGVQGTLSDLQFVER